MWIYLSFDCFAVVQFILQPRIMIVGSGILIWKSLRCLSTSSFLGLWMYTLSFPPFVLYLFLSTTIRKGIGIVHSTGIWFLWFCWYKKFFLFQTISLTIIIHSIPSNQIVDRNFWFQCDKLETWFMHAAYISLPWWQAFCNRGRQSWRNFVRFHLRKGKFFTFNLFLHLFFFH